MNKIVFAGTFDPITNGHFWVIRESLNLAEKVVVFVAENPNKKTMFTSAERKTFIEVEAKRLGIDERVEVVIVRQEYVAQKAKRLGAEYMVRGIRSAGDFDYESLIQKANVDVLGGAKTLFLMPPRELESVSSSFVKSLVGPIGWHHQVKKFLPEIVYNTWLKRFISSHMPAGLDDFVEFSFACYENNRHYHNLEHIAHCFQELDWLVSNHPEAAVNQEQLSVAILGHDVIYGQKSDKTDEQQSADMVLQMLGSDYQVAHDLILATQHMSRPQNLNELEGIMVSIDLAILAQEPEIYKAYTENIRKEYTHVANHLYTKGRKQALERILSNEILYPSVYFKDYEEKARENLQHEMFHLYE